MILRDFQLWLSNQGQRVSINAAAYPISAAVRFDLRRRRPVAPFVKICLTMREAPVGDRSVIVALGTCECFLQVDAAALAAEVSMTDRLVDIALAGLDAIERQVGFRDREIDPVLAACRSHSPPCQHRLDKLTRTSRTGRRCETWFLAGVEQAMLEVRVNDGEREVLRKVVHTVAPPWLIESEFPVKQAKLTATSYSLIDHSGGVLAEVPLSPRTA
jgi:hypothetical protein